jgi:hypothetical protein
VFLGGYALSYGRHPCGVECSGSRDLGVPECAFCVLGPWSRFEASGVYRGTSLMTKHLPPGPYCRPTPRVLGVSYGVWLFHMDEVPIQDSGSRVGVSVLRVWCLGLWGFCVQGFGFGIWGVQRQLAHEKISPLWTLPLAYALFPRGFLGGFAFSYMRGSPVGNKGSG